MSSVSDDGSRLDPDAVTRNRHERRVSEFSHFSELDRFAELTDISPLMEHEGSGGGHALPSTPQEEDQFDLADNDFTDHVINREEIDQTLGQQTAAKAEELVHRVEELAHKVWEAGSRLVTFQALPNWLQDNDFIHRSHRAPTSSFYACFRSIFYIHTETINIWTHLLACVVFLIIALFWLTRSREEIEVQELVTFMWFFVGAISCFSASFLFHTVGCHSRKVQSLFSKFDYCGISLLIIGSFVPWIYYAFYCSFTCKLTYLSAVGLLGLSCMFVSMVNRFGEPAYRPLRAGLFLAFGLSGVVPALHYVHTEGWIDRFALTTLGYLALMGSLYVAGALVYAFRIPERFFPGKFDICFHSHQLFHVLVVAAAMVHYHGVTELAMYRISGTQCIETSTSMIL